MKCSNCGHVNIEGSRFCNQCGFPLSTNKISLGQYEGSEEYATPRQRGSNQREMVKDESLPFSPKGPGGSENIHEGIYDRDQYRQKQRKSPVLKMTLVMLLALFVFVGYNVIKFAVSTQQHRVTQAEIAKEQQAQAEELKRLENYREKFNSVLLSYEEQGTLIDENLKSLTTLRINRFAKGLGLGDVFNKIVNTVLDVSKVNALKENSATLNILVEELVNPPETYLAKYETLGLLKNVENQITETISGKLTSDSKDEIERLYAEFNSLLTDIKR